MGIDFANHECLCVLKGDFADVVRCHLVIDARLRQGRTLVVQFEARAMDVGGVPHDRLRPMGWVHDAFAHHERTHCSVLGFRVGISDLLCSTTMLWHLLIGWF